MSQFLYVFNLALRKAEQGDVQAKDTLKSIFSEMVTQIAANAGNDGTLARLTDDHKQAVSSLIDKIQKG